jgi:hypothetical protein
VFDNGTIEESSEDCSQPIQDLSHNSPRSEHDLLFSYNLQDINDLSTYLGIIWQLEKDQPFAQHTIYIGFLWDLNLHTVSLSPPKVEKYLLAIHTWRKKPTHDLQEALQLYGVETQFSTGWYWPILRLMTTGLHSITSPSCVERFHILCTASLQ